eukprot:TRINITY_DN5372_c0_g1_i3.p2 TRINITY_DN5372_c0_g1~~TRINITY_DN5372_c0_g1_i3.p2  ORF type:complete len:175 (-),score=34.10 TRINITY_DN5372_c0_g1_i3:36-560(-)
MFNTSLTIDGEQIVPPMSNVQVSGDLILEIDSTIVFQVIPLQNGSVTSGSISTTGTLYARNGTVLVDTSLYLADQRFLTLLFEYGTFNGSFQLVSNRDCVTIIAEQGPKTFIANIMVACYQDPTEMRPTFAESATNSISSYLSESSSTNVEESASPLLTSNGMLFLVWFWTLSQ